MVGSAEIADYPIVYCSNGFSEMTGFKRSEVMRYSCDGRFLQRSTVKKDVTDSIDNALRTKTSCQVEFIGKRKNGEAIDVQSPKNIRGPFRMHMNACFCSRSRNACMVFVPCGSN